ncbi:MAG: anhydro-N-acetylmuramic acid kinase, partial [Boseongicola sp.]
RSSDMNFGGQGAPLAPFYHFALANWIGITDPVALLNIGGVANLTWLDPRMQSAEAPGACLAFDTGPGNAKIDDLVQHRIGLRMDEGGTLAAKGRVNDAVLTKLMSREAYFHRVPPKSLDRDDFDHWIPAVSGLSDADAVATLTAATAGAIAQAIEHCPAPPTRMLVTGGGRKNPVMMDMIRKHSDCAVDPIEEVGLDGDMLEAQAFAYLAVRVMRGLPTSAPGTTGVAAPVGGGQISRPGELPQPAQIDDSER